MTSDWKDRLQDRLSESRAIPDAPLHRGTTLRIGGPAECLVEVESERDLLELFDLIQREKLAWHVLGKGSNLLIRDEGIKGVVIRLGKHFTGLGEPDASHRVRAGAALSNATFVEKCRVLGLGGMEYLTAIPGSIGGAIAMNAGAHEGVTAAFLVAVRLFDLETGIREEAAEKFEFSYRHSVLRPERGKIVLAGTFQMTPMENGEIVKRRSQFQQWRREHQPRDFPNCGSVFKNPPGNHAAKLIDDAGLKGHSLGGAQVSEKHANFIVNRGNASATDVLNLVDFIRETVYSETGILLELEMQVL